MTVLPFLDIKATPIRSVESPRSLRTQSFPRIAETNNPPRQQSPHSSHRSNKSSPKRSSIPPARSRTPKIKITPRSDEILKKLPHAKTAGGRAHKSFEKPMIRELPDYDYLWEPLQREDMRHQYDFYVAPQRIIASRPDEPYAMTTMFETEDRHYHNYKRVKAMQQRQWNREHIQYTIYPYAQMVERELYNKNIRTTLKEQIGNKAQSDKNEQEMKSRECQILIQHDREDLEQEKQKQNERARGLLQVTTRNKELMENKWEHDQWDRLHQWHVDRAILADDPVNWSKTMT